jgi:hypothetical protein
MGPILMGTHIVSVSHHVLPYMDILHCQYARQGCTQFKRRVSEVGRCPCSCKRMGTFPIVNGNVCGRFCDMLERKVIFCRYTNNTPLVAK